MQKTRGRKSPAVSPCSMSRPFFLEIDETETDQVAYEERSSILAVPVEVGEMGDSEMRRDGFPQEVTHGKQKRKT